MRPPTINDRKLLRLIDKENKSPAEAAREIGVSRQAVSKRLQELRGKTTKVIVTKKVEQIVDRKIDAMEQFQKINDYANELLDLLMGWQRGDNQALQILESQVKKVKVGQGEDVEWVKEFKFTDPRQLALKAMSEIRGQLALQLDIFRSMYDLQEADRVIQLFLDALRELAPDVREKVVKRLSESRTLRDVIKIN